jgi:hypothetical protein
MQQREITFRKRFVEKEELANTPQNRKRAASARLWA